MSGSIGIDMGRGAPPRLGQERSGTRAGSGLVGRHNHQGLHRRSHQARSQWAITLGSIVVLIALVALTVFVLVGPGHAT